MKRTLVSAAVLALLAGGAGVATAGPGPNGNNNHGLCTAYFAGSETGQENKRKAPPFKALEEAADQADTGNQDGASTEDEVMAFCEAFLGGNGNGNGNNGNPKAERAPKG